MRYRQFSLGTGMSPVSHSLKNVQSAARVEKPGVTLPSRKIAANVDLYVVVGKYPSKIGMCVKTQLCFCSKSKAEHSSTQFWMCIMHERNHSHPLICA